MPTFRLTCFVLIVNILSVHGTVESRVRPQVERPFVGAASFPKREISPEERWESEGSQSDSHPGLPYLLSLTLLPRRFVARQRGELRSAPAIVYPLLLRLSSLLLK